MYMEMEGLLSHSYQHFPADIELKMKFDTDCILQPSFEKYFVKIVTWENIRKHILR